MDNWYSKQKIILVYFLMHFLWKLHRQKGYGLMLFTKVIFSTCDFSQGSLAIAKLTLPLFMSKKCVKLWYNLKNTIKSIVNEGYICSCDYYYGCFKGSIKRTFFTSPQLKITLYKPVFLQLSLMSNSILIIDKIER